ncbi:DoxX family protein, partial [Mycobacteroides abscessus subsp. massiliense]
TGIAPVLSPLAAAGLAVLQAGAFGVHVRRNEGKLAGVNIVLIVLAVFVAFEWYG